uniref:Uncharacterized protein n=1 Tax=Arundo donax TaxID=35708 RepID=A0A0A9C7J1_ARUDO
MTIIATNLKKILSWEKTAKLLVSDTFTIQGRCLWKLRKKLTSWLSFFFKKKSFSMPTGMNCSMTNRSRNYTSVQMAALA